MTRSDRDKIRVAHLGADTDLEQKDGRNVERCYRERHGLKCARAPPMPLLAYCGRSLSRWQARIRWPPPSSSARLFCVPRAPSAERRHISLRSRFVRAGWRRFGGVGLDRHCIIHFFAFLCFTALFLPTLHHRLIWVSL